jgi:hypothetical protein
MAVSTGALVVERLIPCKSKIGLTQNVSASEFRSWPCEGGRCMRNSLLKAEESEINTTLKFTCIAYTV